MTRNNTDKENPAIWATIAAERHRLADELATLTDDQWTAPSHCDGWTVEDVAAHLLVPFDISTPRFALAMMKARGDFDRAMIALTARVKARRSRSEIVEQLHANADSRWTPPGGGAESPLGEVIVHGQDIRRALGLDHSIPTETIELTITGMTDEKLRVNYADRIGVPLPTTNT